LPYRGQTPTPLQAPKRERLGTSRFSVISALQAENQNKIDLGSFFFILHTSTTMEGKDAEVEQIAGPLFPSS
jgi:hypothetical protein